MTESTQAFARFLGRVFSPAWWVVAIAIIVGLLLWRRGSRWSLGAAMAFATAVGCARAAFTLT